VTIRVAQGHAPDVLSQMEAESAHLVCTSPPYWNLRSYSTPPQIWPNPDGTPLCPPIVSEEDWARASAAARAAISKEQHAWGDMTVERNVQPQRDSPGGFHNSTSRGEQPATRGAAAGARGKGAVCLRCGCWRGELGQEPTVERYIANLVSVFDAVRRVLRRDGLCWVNLSGSFFNNPGGQNGTSGNVSARAIAANGQAGRQDRIGAAGKGSWLKPLDWVDTPGLFAHAMQRAGWYWRADIAMVKKSPLPESVAGWKWERCRVKAERRISVTEHEARGHTVPAAWDVGQHTHDRGADSKGRYDKDGQTMIEWADCPGCDKCSKTDGLILRRGNGRPTRAWERFLVFAKAPGAYWDSEGVREPASQPGRVQPTYQRPRKDGYGVGPMQRGEGDKHGQFRDPDRIWCDGSGRNLRDWQFWPTRGGAGSLQHYAAYPIPLAELAIKAGTSERGVCGTCGAPFARVVEREKHPTRDVEAQRAATATRTGRSDGHVSAPEGMVDTTRTTGWRPTCTCGADAPVPAVVLDPFVGSGTTLIAADRLGRSALGIDVQPQYIDLAAGRARRDAPLFADVEVERQAVGRPQLARAWDLFRAAGLGQAHLDAMRAAGITDTGKAQITQTGYGKNVAEVQRLAAEAKGALRGYYRELLGRSIDDAPPLPATVSKQRDLFSVLAEAEGDVVGEEAASE
jgi:DNA modification methylase